MSDPVTPDHDSTNDTTNGTTPSTGSTPSRLRRALALGVLTGAASAIPIWRIPRRPLVAVGGIATAAAATAGVVLARDRAEREAAVQREPLPQPGPGQRIVAPVLTGLVAGGVMAGGLWLTSVTDELSERIVTRLGARHPRATLAVLAGAMTAVLEYVDSGPERPGDRAEGPADVA